MFNNTYGSFFYFFSRIISLRMSDRFETYGSAEIRTIFMNDEEGKLIKSDSLFENLYDFWSCFHMSYKTLFIWYHPKMAQLEKAIRQKWVTTKDLVNIVLNKFKEKDNYFNPMRYLGGDEEKYFEILQQWKIGFEKSYLEQFSHLRRAPIHHMKCLTRSTRPSLR